MSNIPGAVAVLIHSMKSEKNEREYDYALIGFIVFIVIFFGGILFGGDVINNFLNRQPINIYYFFGITLGVGVWLLDFLNRASFNFGINIITLLITAIFQGAYSFLITDFILKKLYPIRRRK